MRFFQDVFAKQVNDRPMKDIAIYGAGGFGREVACLIRIINERQREPEWNLVGFFDDNKELKGKMISHYAPCLGGIDELNEYPEELYLTIPIGNSKTVYSIVQKITNSKVLYPNLIHPDVVFSDPQTFSIGKGNIIQRGCSFSCDVTLGDFNIANAAVALGHDVKLGSFNTVMPAVRVSGGVVIGDYNFFGVGSIILQYVKIGYDVRLGAGSVLITKPRDGKLYMGNPARKTEF